MDDTQYITLTLADGTALKCQVVGVFPFEGKEYVALIPSARGGAVEVLRYESEGEKYTIFSIEDDDEYDRAAEEYERLTGILD